MSVTKELKKEIISKFSSGANDTGSSEVQVALFTKHISNLTEHLKINKKTNLGTTTCFFTSGFAKAGLQNTMFR